MPLPNHCEPSSFSPKHIHGELLPRNPRVKRAPKQCQNIAIERYSMKTKEDKFHFLSIPLMDNATKYNYLVI